MKRSAAKTFRNQYATLRVAEYSCRNIKMIHWLKLNGDLSVQLAMTLFELLPGSARTGLIATDLAAVSHKGLNVLQRGSAWLGATLWVFTESAGFGMLILH